MSFLNQQIKRKMTLCVVDTTNLSDVTAEQQFSLPGTASTVTVDVPEDANRTASELRGIIADAVEPIASVGTHVIILGSSDATQSPRAGVTYHEVNLDYELAYGKNNPAVLSLAAGSILGVLTR